MTDTATTASAVATDAVPSSAPQADAPMTTGKPRDEAGRFAPTEKTTTAPPEAAAEQLLDAGEPAKEAVHSDEVVTPEQAKDRDQKKASAKERINQITAQKYEAIQRAERAERREKELVKQLRDLQSADPLDPTIDMRRAVKVESLEQNRVELVEAKNAEATARTNEFRTKIDAARDSIPNLDQSLDVFGRIMFSDQACDVIASSDKAAELANYFGRNPQEGHRIANLPTHFQAAEIARIESRLQAPKPKTISTAPRPAATLGGGSSPSAKDLSSMSMSEFHAAWTKKAR